MRKQAKENPPIFRGLHLVAGHPALDLANTVKYRGQPDPQDRLLDFATVVDWAQVAGLIDGVQADMLAQKDSPAVWRRVLALREGLWALLNANQVSPEAVAQARGTIEAAISKVRYRVLIAPETGVLRKEVELRGPQDLLARIADSIADLLARRADLLIKTCDGCDCDWVFIDRTKARRRRWCDTRTCGNLARVRDHRKKHKTTEQRHAG